MILKWNIKIGKTETSFADWESARSFIESYALDSQAVHKTCFIKGKKFTFTHQDIECSVKYS